MESDPTRDTSKEKEAQREKEKEDIEIMLRVKTGNEAAFTELIKRHQSTVVNTVARMLGDPDEALDIAQHVFIRVWKSAPRYEPNAKFTTWLFTITKNLVYNESRRRSRRKQVSLEEREEDSFETGTEDLSVRRPDDNVLFDEMQVAIDEAIQQLPEKQRLAVVLRRFEQLPYEQISEILGITVPAVKSLLFRARSQLRASLQTYLDS